MLYLIDVYISIQVILGFGERLTTRSRDLIADKSREIISGSQLFMGLTDEVLLRIIENSSEMEINAGHLIIKEGDPLKGLCIIVDGETSIENNKGDELFTRRVGESLGEMTLIDLGTRSVSVRAKSDVKIVVISLKYLSSLFDDDPNILATVAINIARILSIRLRESIL